MNAQEPSGGIAAGGSPSPKATAQGGLHATPAPGPAKPTRPRRAAAVVAAPAVIVPAATSATPAPTQASTAAASRRRRAQAERRRARRAALRAERAATHVLATTPDVPSLPTPSFARQDDGRARALALSGLALLVLALSSGALLALAARAQRPPTGH